MSSTSADREPLTETPKKAQAPAYIHWCFTSYDMSKCPSDVFTAEEVKYYTFQMETCPDTGRKHFQGYLQLIKKQRLTWLKVHIDDKWHWGERARAAGASS